MGIEKNRRPAPTSAPQYAQPTTACASITAALFGFPGFVMLYLAPLGEYTPPLRSTGLFGAGLGGDNSPRMIAFQARIEF